MCVSGEEGVLIGSYSVEHAGIDSAEGILVAPDLIMNIKCTWDWFAHETDGGMSGFSIVPSHHDSLFYFTKTVNVI